MRISILFLICLVVENTAFFLKKSRRSGRNEHEEIENPIYEPYGGGSRRSRRSADDIYSLAGRPRGGSLGRNRRSLRGDDNGSDHTYMTIEEGDTGKGRSKRSLFGKSKSKKGRHKGSKKGKGLFGRKKKAPPSEEHIYESVGSPYHGGSKRSSSRKSKNGRPSSRGRKKRFF
ncbi:hypothetical protein RUM44_011476 [Polyplax serrata]|uniref:Uncharacterized protein n=1 Tax=Polyplax serrata TaxID=468196 RepID=A0ABR1AQU0_POLSC